MTLAVFPSSRRGLPAELRQRQPLLTVFGLILLAMAVPVALAALFDPRTLEGVGVWIKPLKFLLSVSLYALTFAWFFGYLPEERRHARPARVIVWTILIAGTFEIAYITLQGARGLASHFNESTPFYTFMYGLMGVGALLLTATAALLARELGRHAPPRLPAVFRHSLVVGLAATFVLGSLSGLVISQLGQQVGADGGGTTLPFFGWSRTGGDLRVAHFFALHALQVLPLAGAGLARLPSRPALALFWPFAAAYLLWTLFTLVQALQGEPLLPA